MLDQSPLGLNIYTWLRPMLFRLPPETAHRTAISALRLGLYPRLAIKDDPRLAVSLWGKHFPNPIGLAAGFDKDVQVWRQALRVGFGFAEAGSITPLPQPGNPKPRLFRLVRDQAIINRMGFNSGGHEAALRNLGRRSAGDGILGINLGKNKESLDAAEDYALGARQFGALADYIVINVSSPNTPGLRALQSLDQLSRVVERTRSGLAESRARPPLLLKIAPDLAQEDLKDIAGLALTGALDGLIVSNTTISRPPGLDPVMARETGGLSGRPLFELSTNTLRDMYKLTEGKVPLIGVGGISSGADAYAKIRAGASLVQFYTGLVYEGLGLIARMKRDLIACLERDGHGHIGEAVGRDHR